MEASVLEKQLKIVYYYNSGFSVQVGSTLFLFDYWAVSYTHLTLPTIPWV